MDMKNTIANLLLLLILCGCAVDSKPGFSDATDREMVRAILENLDSHTLDMETKMSVYHDDAIHMGQGKRAITNLKDLEALLTEERQWGHSEMKHEAYEIHSYADHVIVRGGVKGTWHSKDGETEVPFETNNLLTLKRIPEGGLKV